MPVVGGKNITLMGMAGVGKSTLGRELAKVLKYRFLDVDDLIEKKFALKLQAIVDHYGEKRFLAIEEQAVLELGALEHCVISPGGSVIYSTKAMAFLSQISVVIFLDASFKSIRKRILNLTTRGIIGLKGKTLEEIYQERRPLYRSYAAITVTLPEQLNSKIVIGEIMKQLPDALRMKREDS